MGFGSTRLTISRDVERALSVLRHAVELGVNHVDTDTFYVSPGGIPKEPRAGPATPGAHPGALTPYDDLVSTTMLGPAADLRRQVDENLRRLGVDRLDVVNLRIIKKARQDSVAERFEALARMREEGLIRHPGLSNVPSGPSRGGTAHCARWFVCRTAMRSTTSSTPCC